MRCLAVNPRVRAGWRTSRLDLSNHQYWNKSPSNGTTAATSSILVRSMSSLTRFRSPTASLTDASSSALWRFGLQSQRSSITPTFAGSRRCFQSEGHYHTVADETLEGIQDAVEQALEENGIPEFEIGLASGVLTLQLNPHGTWVINKQTPNQQLWWSSPLSGPKRFEYDPDGKDWVFTRDESHTTKLLQTLKEEIQQVYKVEVDL